MKLFTIFSLCGLVSAVALASPANLKPSTTIASLQPTATNAQALANWNKFNNLSKGKWNNAGYKNKVVQYHKNSTHHITPAIQRDLEARQDFGGWAATGFSSDDWGWSFHWHHTPCDPAYAEDLQAGHIVKIVVKEDLGRTQFKYWYNQTERRKPIPIPMPGMCDIYGGWRLQCQNKIWMTNLKRWEILSPSNKDTGWTTNNATFDGHTVRTIYDCLLDMPAIEYNTTVTALGTKPIQYKIGGLTYYRWYDSNNFAWFAACPTGGLNKRQGIKGWNSNPVWDYSTFFQKHQFADQTLPPANQIPNYDRYTSYAAMYWPKANNQTIVIDGHECTYMAASRPGLRHWTARLVEIPPETYPSIRDEMWFPLGWEGFTKWHWSWENSTVTKW